MNTGAAAALARMVAGMRRPAAMTVAVAALALTGCGSSAPAPTTTQTQTLTNPGQLPPSKPPSTPQQGHATTPQDVILLARAYARQSRRVPAAVKADLAAAKATSAPGQVTFHARGIDVAVCVNGRQVTDAAVVKTAEPTSCHAGKLTHG